MGQEGALKVTQSAHQHCRKLKAKKLFHVISHPIQHSSTGERMDYFVNAPGNGKWTNRER